MALKDYEYKENTYVKVYGSIRVFKEEKAIVGTKIEQIEKHDNITNHFLQVFVSSQIRHKGILTSNDIKMESGNNNTQSNMGGGF